MPRRRRKALPLHPRGSFQFTERTFSVELGALEETPTGKAARTILHVGRSRGALEFPGTGHPAREIDAARVLELLDMENARRAALKYGNEEERRPIHLEIDQGVLACLRIAAKRQHGTDFPFAGRPRRCWETNGAHPGESLWLVAFPTEIAIETAVSSADPGKPASRTYRPVLARDALQWLVEEGAVYFPTELLRIAETTVDEIRSKGKTASKPDATSSRDS